MNSTISAPPAPRTWRSALHILRREQNSRILGGSLLMLIGSGLVSARHMFA